MITKEQAQQILALWQEGLTGGQIATQLSITRNSVLGVVHRLRKRGADIEGRIKKPQVRIKIIEAVKGQEEEIILENIFIPIEKSIVNEDNEYTDLMGLRFNSCRFIVEEGNVETTKYCNKAIHRSSYCKDHYKICYVSPRRDYINLRL